MLRLFLSSESDPYFLQLLEVGEEEYALLRQDQGIRVDFPNFPGKLIGLLDKCIACKAEDLPRCEDLHRWPRGVGGGRVRSVSPPAAAGPGGPPACGPTRRVRWLRQRRAPLRAAPPQPLRPAADCLCRFQAVLSVGGGGAAGQGSLRVVENNDFKQLPHITLALRPGSDAAVKQWLAFRLGELRGDAGQLSQDLERTQASRGVGHGGVPGLASGRGWLALGRGSWWCAAGTSQMGRAWLLFVCM